MFNVYQKDIENVECQPYKDGLLQKTYRRK